MSLIEIVYVASAIIGGLLFLFRLALMVFGGIDHGGDIDLGGGHDIHLGDTPHGDADSDVSFKFLSIQGISAFFMMFGLVGLALSQAKLHPLLTVLGGVGAGVFTVWIVSLIFKGMKKLQVDGTLWIENAIGQEGIVYLTIPAKGSGQVSVTVQGGLKEFDAISVDNTEIVTGERIRVVRIASGNTLVVEPVQKAKSD